MTTCSPTTYSPGDLLKVSLLFSDQKGSKPRPAVVISVPDVQRSRNDIMVVPLSRKAGRYFGDRPVRDWKQAKLNEPTFIKAVVMTVWLGNVERVWGQLSAYDYQQVQDAVRQVLDV